HDHLPGLEDVLDAGVLALLLDVLGVVLHVAPVQHRVLRRRDVDERGLHAREHVLHPAEIDVAVDLGDVVGRARHVVLDEVAALEHGDLRHARTDLDAHEVAADRPAVALPALALLHQLLLGGRGLLLLAATPAAALRRRLGGPVVTLRRRFVGARLATAGLAAGLAAALATLRATTARPGAPVLGRGRDGSSRR